MGDQDWAGRAARFVGPDTVTIGPDLAGFALAFADGQFRIDLMAPSGDVALSLGPYCETEIVAAWRSVANASGLPLLVAHEDGRVSELTPRIGRIAVGPSRDRSRLVVLSGRRPRFLARRKTGSLPARPTMVAGCELASGSAR